MKIKNTEQCTPQWMHLTNNVHIKSKRHAQAITRFMISRGYFNFKLKPLS